MENECTFIFYQNYFLGQNWLKVFLFSCDNIWQNSGTKDTTQSVVNKLNYKVIG